MLAAASMHWKYYLWAALAGLVSGGVSLPFWRSWCRRHGIVDDPGHRKIHVIPTPLAGGLAVLTGLLLPLAGAMLFLSFGWVETMIAEKLAYGISKRALPLAAVLLGGAVMGLIGWLDDRFELRPSMKFGGQVLAALLAALAGVRITLFVDSVWFSYLVTILWILTVTNALNFMDNMNGLCAGLAIIGSVCIGGIAASHDQYLVALLAWLGAGAFAGFLPFNFPRASVFLGDSGSHLAGYWLGIMAIMPHFYSPKHPEVWAVFSPLLILAVPLGDLAWVVVLRWRSGQPFYVGDTNHLSHRLVRQGLSKAIAVLLIWTLAALSGGLAWWLNR
jgi:UDP-GlcNAc:undecaprenyl-phosphate GlcNAc-1-phosphate transferase